MSDELSGTVAWAASRASSPRTVADVIASIVTRPRRVALNEVLVRPTEQDW